MLCYYKIQVEKEICNIFSKRDYCRKDRGDTKSSVKIYFEETPKKYIMFSHTYYLRIQHI